MTATGITREARAYALRELVRRARVREDFFRSWEIDFGADWTTIYLGAEKKKSIRFRNALPQGTRSRMPSMNVARASWPLPPENSVRQLVPDFVMPFVSQEGDCRAPLFRQVSADRLECEFDLPLSVLLSLSRFEEYVVRERDEHARFSASQSLAFREGFLTRPVVDELGLAMEQALLYLLPAWRPEPRKLRVKLSHDVDLTGTPFDWRAAIGHTLRRGKPSATLRDLLAKISSLKPTYLSLVQKVVQLSLDYGLDSAVYWKAGRPGVRDAGYDPRERKIQEVIAWLRKHEVECGVHPGYETFDHRDLLRSEVNVVREALGEDFIGGRQHYLRWKPETWLDWEACELAYDSTVGFADHVGFRAGTCFPYRPWVLSANREVRLLEIPLIVMDRTPVAYMDISSEKSLELVEQYVDRCRLVGGVFTLLWHNSTLIEPEYGNLYVEILETLSGSDRFDWRTARREWSSGCAAETAVKSQLKHQAANTSR